MFGIGSARTRVKQAYTEVTQAAAEAQVRHDQSVAALEGEFQSRSTAGESQFRQETATTVQQYDAAVRTAGQEKDLRLAAALQEFERSAGHAASALDEVMEGLGPWITLPWNAAAWAEYRPPTQGYIPDLLRIGEYSIAGYKSSLHYPALHPFTRRPNFVIQAGGDQKKLAIEILQSLVLRLLATIPPGNMRLTLMDPVGRGQNVAGFMRLMERRSDPMFITRAWTEEPQIIQRLQDLTAEMEDVIQYRLKNKFRTIQEYNDYRPVKEPYRFLVVADFPHNFSEAAARRLLSIAATGPRCGVYTFVMVDLDQPMPRGFNLEDLERAATTLRWKDGGFLYPTEDVRFAGIAFDRLPKAHDDTPGETVQEFTEVFNRVLDSVKIAAEEAKDTIVPFPPPVDLWPVARRAESDIRIKVALGPGEEVDKPQELDLNEVNEAHALIAGQTGSGKSTLFHTLITNVALTYHPDDVQLYLIDFKQGVEFKVYAVNELPHARVVAIETEREFGLSVLQKLKAEIDRRSDLFRNAGVQNLSGHRAAGREARARGEPVEHLPRIVVLVDEYQQFFIQDDAISQRAKTLLEEIARQGRSYGVHMILSSQTLTGSASLPQAILSQMIVRIALRCSDADSRMILAADNGEARLLTRKGEAIYNPKVGMFGHNARFQVSFLDDTEKTRQLGRITIKAREVYGVRPPRPTVFEGNAVASLAGNDDLNALLTDGSHERAQRPPAWLGEPIALESPIAATFQRLSGRNLLILGQDEHQQPGQPQTGAALLGAAMLSLGAHHRGDARICLVDLSAEEDEDPGTALLRRMACGSPTPVELANRADLGDLMVAVAEDVRRRRAGGRGHKQPPVYLLLHGLQWALDLRPEESGRATPLSTDDLFKSIVREGPEVGVHVLAWCDTILSVQKTAIGRSLRDFTLRVALQMSATDSNTFIDTRAAASLGAHRAFFFNEERGRLDKFRPYSVPTDITSRAAFYLWLDDVITRHGVPPVPVRLPGATVSAEAAYLSPANGVHPLSAATASTAAHGRDNFDMQLDNFLSGRGSSPRSIIMPPSGEPAAYFALLDSFLRSNGAPNAPGVQQPRAVARPPIRATAGSGRTVTFPDDAHLGTLLIRDRGRGEGWTLLGDATGAVHVPDGHDLMLRVALDTGDLSALALLEPDDLQALEIPGGRGDAVHLAAVAALGGLEELDLRWTTFDDGGMRFLRRLSMLRRLFLDGTRITDEGIARMPDLPDLRSLSLADTTITGMSLNHLRRFPSLEELNLGATAIDDDALAEMTILNGLRRLSLRHTRIGDGGVAHLDCHTALEALNLSSTSIGDSGTARIAALPSLRELDLSATPVGDDGVAHLAGLHSLDVLNLSYTRVTARGLGILAGVSSLRELSIDGIGDCDEAVASLQDALPKAVILR